MNWEETHGRLTARVDDISRQCGAWWDISLTRSGIVLEGRLTIAGETFPIGLRSARTIGKLKHHAEMVNDLIFMSVARLEEELLLPSSRKEEARIILAAKKGVQL